LEERATFVMNTMKSSFKFKFSYHSYSNAYKLEYSCLHVIIVIYELAYSLDVMILTCLTSCLNIHMTSMSRSRVRLRWRFVVSSGLSISFICQSVGSGTRGGICSFFVHGHGARVHGICGYDGIPRLRGRRQVVTALSVPCNPSRLGIVYES
jgi:hypothetical protein